jgi:hypothetical protein
MMSLALLAGVVAAIAVAAPRAVAGQAGPSATRVLLCAADGTFTTAFVPIAGPSWSLDGRGGDRWYLMVDRVTTCRTGLVVFRELARRTASEGTTGQVAFTLTGGWSCVASRVARQGGCSVSIKGSDRFVLVVADVSEASRLTARILLDGDADPTTIAPPPRPSTSTPSGPASTPAAKRGEECSPLMGAPWQVRYAGRTTTGQSWRIAAVGGLSCLAAKGWASELVAAMPGQPGYRPTFDGGDGWRCTTSTAPIVVGACYRTTGPRGPLDFRGVVVAPAQRQDGVASLPLTIEEALIPIVDSRPAPAAVREKAPKVCAVKPIPGREWTIDSESGGRWTIAVRSGYPCPLALTAAFAPLAEWALEGEAGATNRAGVEENWTCIRLPEPGIRCYGFGPFSRYKLAVIPYRTRRSVAENTTAALAAVR